jgi:hypothetical protein
MAEVNGEVSRGERSEEDGFESPTDSVVDRQHGTAIACVARGGRKAGGGWSVVAGAVGQQRGGGSCPCGARSEVSGVGDCSTGRAQFGAQSFFQLFKNCSIFAIQICCHPEFQKRSNLAWC